ncbi:TA system VapC family ribonuclease toxin [Agilicoccus flavus]|uniref:TA system VapC family ribonuclease toxin n=1 Tax=Agilicoccus flavus TaxID=2775968 RepID=UPI001CF6751F|nr:TA system VapC family ribonuclease toxin [Agilicoccus flavus]
MTDPVSGYLLDVNVLVALVDPGHAHHDLAHEWFERTGAANFATCPFTENGLLRVVGHPRYPHTAGSPAGAAPLLVGIRSLPGHSFWPDTASLVDSPLVDPDRLAGSAQVIDAYLLASAATNGGKLATFDRHLATAAIQGGREALHVITSRPGS